MGPTALFDTIHELHCTISTNFYFYLQYFQQYFFTFSKISGIETHSTRNLIQLKTIIYMEKKKNIL